MKKALRITWCAVAIIGAMPVAALAQSSSSSSSSSVDPAASAPFPDPNAPFPPDIAQRYLHARWAYPGARQMAELYPAGAQDEHRSGTVKIQCMIGSDGYMAKCRVLNEDPKGYGFGVATATAFVNFCHVDPATVAGGIQPGDYKGFIYKWQVG